MPWKRAALAQKFSASKKCFNSATAVMPWKR